MEPIGFKMKWVFCLMGLLLAFWTVLSFGIFSFPCSKFSWAFSLFIIISCSCFKLHCFACGISSFYVHGWPFLLALCFCSPRYQPSLSTDSSPLFLPPLFFSLSHAFSFTCPDLALYFHMAAQKTADFQSHFPRSKQLTCGVVRKMNKNNPSIQRGLNKFFNKIT